MDGLEGKGGVDWGLLALRLGCAALLIGFHGGARFGRAINYVFRGQPWTFVNLVGTIGFPFPALFAVLSAFAESVAAVLLALGLYTRWAALMIAIDMAVALYNETSKGDPFELPGMYFLIAVTLVLAGGGFYSLDRLIRARRSPRPRVESPL